METFEDITAARRAIRRCLATAEGQLPDDTFAEFEDLADSPSPVDAIARTAELLYARRDELDDGGRTLAGQLASFAAVNAWHSMAEGNRGGLIAQAMARDVGKAKPRVDKADPEPLETYVRKAEPKEGEATMPA